MRFYEASRTFREHSQWSGVPRFSFLNVKQNNIIETERHLLSTLLRAEATTEEAVVRFYRPSQMRLENHRQVSEEHKSSQVNG